MENQIIHFTFQLCRKTPCSYSYTSLEKNDTLVTLENQLNDLLFSLKGYLSIVEYQDEKNKYLDLLSFLFKLIAYTRDIYDGKGERDLTYSMITVWYKYFPKLAMYIFEQLCSSSLSEEKDNNQHKKNTIFGSWKDAKYLCHYIKKNTNILSEEKQEKCIQTIIQLMNNQLYIDYTQQKNLSLTERERETTHGSLIAKWIPREKSKFGWLYESLVKNWNENFENPTQRQSQTPTPHQTYKKYRKIITSLNKKLDTPQIKQCERKSNEINYYHVSLITKHKHVDYFLQNPTKPKIQSPQRSDSNQTQTKKPILHYDLGELCRGNNPEKNTNILLWNKIRENIISSKSNQKKYILPILDMTSNNVEDGIAISILLSEISEIPNRIMTYDQKQAIWISLEHSLSLYEKKRQIENHMIIKNQTPDSTNKKNHSSIAAIEYIIKSILETKLPLEKIEDMYLVFISDFQILDAHELDQNHYSLIQKTFRENGITKIPNILYWNISTEIVHNLPCSPTTSNVLFLAGTASSNFQLLFEFDKTDTDSTPINSFSYYKKILNQDKYQSLERYLYQYFR